MLAETPVTQHSPYYSAVSASLTNPLPDCSNYSPFCHTHYLILWPDEYFTSLMGQTLYQPAPLENTSPAESSRELMSSEEYRGALRKLNNKQRQVVMFFLLFKLSSQLPFVSFSFLSISIPSLLPFSILSLLPFLISPSPSTIPSFSSDQFSVLLR